MLCAGVMIFTGGGVRSGRDTKRIVGGGGPFACFAAVVVSDDVLFPQPASASPIATSAGAPRITRGAYVSTGRNGS